MTLSLAATAVVIAPNLAGASPPDALTRVSSDTSVTGAADVDYDADRLAIADTDASSVVASGTTISSFGASDSLDSPRGVAWGPNELYVSDTGNDRVLEFVLDGEEWVLSNEWSLGVGSDPRGLDYGGGLVYVADAGLDKVHKLSLIHI